MIVLAYTGRDDLDFKSSGEVGLRFSLITSTFFKNVENKFGAGGRVEAGYYEIVSLSLFWVSGFTQPVLRWFRYGVSLTDGGSVNSVNCARECAMPRPCLICSDGRKSQKVAELIGRGLSDERVADTLNKLFPRQPVSFMAVNRHRKSHLLPQTQDGLALVAKDRDARARRQELAAAAAADTPSTQALVEATLGIRAQVKKLGDIEERLARVANAAEREGAFAGVAALAGQQLRGLEYGSRLAGHPGFTPRANDGAGGADGRRFSIVINLGPEKTVSINATPVPQPAEVEGEIADEGEGEE
jgi:hypothetical protein